MIELIEADITEQRVDAIVNAANSHLQHGSGVAGAIVRRGGQVIQDESNRVGYVPVGEAAVTGAGALPCRYVIHAVGPMMGEGDEDAKLRNATLASMRKAEELGIESIAFPAISTGIFGYPIERCAEIMLTSVKEFLEGRAGFQPAPAGWKPAAPSLKRVVFCLFGSAALDVFRKAHERITDAG